MKKITLSSELAYLLHIIILSFAVAMLSCVNFGLSMIVSPAFIVSEWLPFLTFGQAEYIVQGILFVLMCFLLRRFRLTYLFAFLTGIIYGGVLDFWRAVIPHFNPDITVPGSLPLTLRCVYFVLGIILTTFSIALAFRSYVCPQVYDFFVKAVSNGLNIDRNRFKLVFDFSFLLLACVLTLAVFGKFVGVGVGTIVMSFINGPAIGFFDKLLGKFFEFKSSFPKIEKYFDLQ